MMTGSGARLFAEFTSPDQAEAVLARLPAGLRAWMAAGLDRHPLADLEY